MATSVDFIEYVCEQIKDTGIVSYKKMFGEYMVYLDDKPVILVCDGTVYVKMLDCIADSMADASTGIPYKGAKEYYILDIDNTILSCEVVLAIWQVIPFPKPKAPKKKKAQG